VKPEAARIFACAVTPLTSRKSPAIRRYLLAARYSGIAIALMIRDIPITISISSVEKPAWCLLFFAVFMRSAIGSS
jgi:hypothetical protein